MKKNPLYVFCLVLVIIGGLNWGLVGLLSFDLVSAIFGTITFLSKLIYDLVGLAAVYLFFSLFSKKE